MPFKHPSTWASQAFRNGKSTAGGPCEVGSNVPLDIEVEDGIGSRHACEHVSLRPLQ